MAGVKTEELLSRSPGWGCGRGLFLTIGRGLAQKESSGSNALSFTETVVGAAVRAAVKR